jgi:hypothetical protein
VKPNMLVFDVLDFNWLTCWVNTLAYVYSYFWEEKKRVSVSSYSKLFC